MEFPALRFPLKRRIILRTLVVLDDPEKVLGVELLKNDVLKALFIERM